MVIFLLLLACLPSTRGARWVRVEDNAAPVLDTSEVPAVSPGDIVHAFEAVCLMLQSMKSQLDHLQQSVDHLEPRFHCDSGWGYYDVSGLWRPFSCGVPLF